MSIEPQYKCARCGAPWFQGDARAFCYQCEYDQKILATAPMPDDVPPMTAHHRVQHTEQPSPEPAEASPLPGYALRTNQVQAVTVVDIHLSWGAAIDIAFKFAVVFLAGQIIVAVILFALFG